MLRFSDCRLYACAVALAGAAACGSSLTEGSSAAPPPASQSDSVGAWRLILAGFSHFCGLTKTSAAYCWGTGSRGELGDGATHDSSIPVAVAGGIQFSSLAIGRYRTCGLSVQGEGYCWGFAQSTIVAAPAKLGGGHAYVGLALDDDYTCGVMATGAVDCWGPFADFQLVPQAVVASAGFATIFGGVLGSSLCGLTAEGVPYCWGSHDALNVLVAVRQPTVTSLVTLATNGGPDALSHHTCGVDASGAAYCWGANDHGQLGDGTTVPSGSPVEVHGGLKFVQLVSSAGATMGLTSDGAVYYWGSWFDSSSTVPSQLVSRKFARVSIGYTDMCGVTPRGGGYCWSSNFTPVRVLDPP